METQYKPLADKIAKDKKFDAEIEKQARAMIEEFKKTVSYDEAKTVVVEPKRTTVEPNEPEAKRPAEAKA